MTTADIQALSIMEKLQLMEALWEDLRANFDALPLSESQREILDQRRRDAESGASPLLDWDAVKATIGRA